MKKNIVEYPLTYPQKSIWYLEKLYPGTGIGNIAATLKVHERLDYNLMNRSVNLLLTRNESFWIHFREDNGTPVQCFSDPQVYHIDEFDFRGIDREKLYAWDQQQAPIPFILDGNELFYFALIHIDENTSGLFTRIHHSIADAWSLTQIGSEILLYYRALKNDEPLPEAKNPSYREFIENEQLYLNSKRFLKDKTFWAEQFDHIPEPTTLKPRTSKKISLKANRKTYLLPEKLVNKIKDHCKENHTSIFSLFFAALSIYLNRVKACEDITIGTPVLNRTSAMEKQTIGMFISTVPLRIKMDGNLNFVAFSKLVDQTWFAALKHQKYPYDCLMRDVRDRAEGVERLFDIALSYQNAKIIHSEIDVETESRWHFSGFQAESLYLHINDHDDEGKILLNYDYLSELFYEKEIEFLHDHLIRLLWHALDNPMRQLSQVHMLSANELETVLHEFNQTDAAFPQNLTVKEILEEQAALYPERIALSLNGKGITYHELNARANRLARILRNRGVEPEKIVALLMPRSLEMIVSMLAVVKAGGAYLPIDPRYPSDRINFMLTDSGSPFLLTVENTSPAQGFSGEIIALNEDLAGVPNILDETNLTTVNRPEDLLYVIYTSGSTGNPKGTMIEHRNVVRLLINDRLQFSFGPEDVWTMFHSYCFDFSVWEMYGAFFYGGKLVMVPRETAQDTDQFLRLLQREKVTVLNQTPAAFYNLIHVEGKEPEPSLGLRYVIFGGEALKPSLLIPFRQRYPETDLINMYGITETTVHVTFLKLTDNDLERGISNIGRPIPTNRVYILDRYLNPLPIGVPGELCVSGDGVGRGYLNNPALTNERFVPSPFVPGERLYRSGDLARFFPKGDMEYLGRIDTQVKIRGHRIELGEIESRMLAFDGIREAVVITRDTVQGTHQLAAYYVGDRAIDEESLYLFLEKTLPDYMIPAGLFQLPALPINSNGKIDRKSLQSFGNIKKEKSVDFKAPETDFQQSIASVWRDVLGLENIGINDNFFRLGGDSLAVVMAAAQLGENVEFADFYQNPTIESLARALEEKQASSYDRQLLMQLSENADREQAIICFPYGGGTGIVYGDLAAAVEKTSGKYCLYAVNLPGHDPGDDREMISIEEAADRLVQEIQEQIAGKITLYGHCVGNALTLETARKLKVLGRDIEMIYLGGILPPGNTRLLGQNFDPWKLVPDRNIVKYLNRIGLPALDAPKDRLDAIVNCFRHDVRSYYRFFYEFDKTSNGKLNIPVCCVVGDNDPVTRNYPKKFKRWSRYAEVVDLQILKEAGHYFIKNNSQELARILTRH
ncbi:MAG: amino acid adenylation domain-containing protein [Bacillota bacterium]|nr:amino acid adenylation domain-containing protein [Bacillota bacterium]